MWAALPPAMAVDSEAVFRQRLEELGLQERAATFGNLGWASHGLFAFAVPAGAGGTIEDEVFVTKVIRPLFELGPEDALPALAAAVRRLWFESHTLTVGELRQKLERTDQDAPRKLPQAEREARKEAIRKRLAPGLDIEGDLEPANCVVDRMGTMLDEGVLEYVAWEDVPKRDQELAAAPIKRKWAADAAGVVREKAVRQDPAADTSTALRVSWALQRRGVALEIAGLMTYEAHEKIRLKLISAITKDTPDPRYAPASLDQTKAADREIWRQLSKKAKGQLRAKTPMDPPPLEAFIEDILKSMEVNLILMPLPKAGGQTRKRDPDGDESPEKTENTRSKRRAKQVQSLKKQVEEARASNTQQPHANAGGKPAGGGKSGDRGGKTWGPPMPKQLWGGVATAEDGQRLCFGYNLGTCKVKGERCDKGLHACTRKGCGGKHPASECVM